MVTSGNIPTVSLLDSLFYNLVHVIPYYLRGIFTPNRFWIRVWTALHPDPAAVKFVTRLRRKYRSDYCYLHMLTTRSLLVLDRDGIRHVLDHSPEIYADAKLKRVGMSHFQPGALTISRGEEWRDRRRFNEAVLESGHVHDCAGPFLEVISAEVIATLQSTRDILAWDDFAGLFERISMRIIFGQRIADTSLPRTLRQMMRESNRGFALHKSAYFDEFYATLHRFREEAHDSSLACLCNRIPALPDTPVDNQITHWMFAMGDTLAINTARAIALILAHPGAEQRVRETMGQADLSSARDIDGLQYLEACVQEAMRLWPTTPMLVRETLRDDMLGGAPVASGTQVIILNSFNHRDPKLNPSADSFAPEMWLQEKVNYQFNHLSNGPQGCAGKDLALFIAKAVIATLLAQGHYVLKRPRLDPARPLPQAYDHFQLRFARARW